MKEQELIVIFISVINLLLTIKGQFRYLYCKVYFFLDRRLVYRIDGVFIYSLNSLIYWYSCSEIKFCVQIKGINLKR